MAPNLVGQRFDGLGSSPASSFRESSQGDLSPCLAPPMMRQPSARWSSTQLPGRFHVTLRDVHLGASGLYTRTRGMHEGMAVWQMEGGEHRLAMNRLGFWRIVEDELQMVEHDAGLVFCMEAAGDQHPPLGLRNWK